MFAQAHFPEQLHPEELDRYLSQGWFRMGQTIFTTNFLHFKDEFYSAIWLRIALNDLGDNRTLQKLSKLNSNFKISCQAATLTPEKEMLYAKYRQSLSFMPSASLHQLLYGRAGHNIFDTREITIHHGEKLIATGYFDLGRQSAAGITSFYDPDYKKYSLGRYLIYRKIACCRQMGLTYFYPGYFVPGYRFFDYKLKIGASALEYLRFATNTWLPISDFSPAETPLQIMRDKLTHLQNMFHSHHLASDIYYYEFFDANLYPELQGAEVFDYPVFLALSEIMHDKFNGLIVYDVRTNRFRLVECISLWKSDTVDTPHHIFSSHLLKIEHELLGAGQAEEFFAAVVNEIRS